MCRGGVRVMMLTWKAEDNFLESLFLQFANWIPEMEHRFSLAATAFTNWVSRWPKSSSS